MGIGDWGLGFGGWGLGGGGLGPTPQSPIPNPQSPIPKIKFNNQISKKYFNLLKTFNIIESIYILFK
jgi:hypothetical protein